MTNLMGSFVRWRISVSNSLAALADAKLSITATPSSPMTKPPFAAATPFAAGLSIAAHTFAPTCFSVKEGTGVLCACPTAGIKSRAHDVTTATRARMVVRMLIWTPSAGFGPDFRSSTRRNADAGSTLVALGVRRLFRLKVYLGNLLPGYPHLDDGQR